MFGTLKFKKDYIIIPKGTIYRMEFDDSDDRVRGEPRCPRFLVIETVNSSHILPPPGTSRSRRASSSSTPPTASAT
jgi:homogentisate 1,2-dioxygenase